MLDPIADKLLVGALLIVLAWTRQLSAGISSRRSPSWSARSSSPACASSSGRRTSSSTSPLAKWKTTAQLVALAIVILESLVPGLGLVSDIVLWIAGILTVVTGTQYLGALPAPRR
jgi:cardiolipin synthase